MKRLNLIVTDVVMIVFILLSVLKPVGTITIVTAALFAVASVTWHVSYYRINRKIY